MATTQVKTCESGNLNLWTDSVSMVRVIVRVRPFLPREISSIGNPIPCVSLLDSSLALGNEIAIHLKDLRTARNESYKLDSFYGQEDNNVRQIFEREVMPLIASILNGYNATVFSYGATGSGKTFTMQGNDDLPGLMPLAMATVLCMCENTESSVEISYYEIYLERCYDLLEVKAKEIGIWDGKDGQPHLKGLTKVPIKSMLEFQQVFSCGVQRRKVAHTGLNDVSSRSHGVLVISVSRSCENGSGNYMIGKLNLIDLAGNEDNRRSGNEGVRLLESTKINQSLFALSNVIYALNNKSSRVPYRESKLTRILQDSLGGTSHALMVACLNPGEYDQSVHTVSLAARSRRISNSIHSAQKHNTPKTQVDMEAKLQAWLESKGKTKTAQKSDAFRSTTPNSISFMKRLNTYQSSGKPKNGVVNLKERCNLSNNKGLTNTIMRKDEGAEKKKINKEFKGFGDRNSCASEQHIENVEKVITPMAKVDMSEGIKELRKVLSPINSNINIDNMSFRDQICSVLCDPKTPKRCIADDEMNNRDTPLDKFKALSSNLKSTLAQEYIDFLNSASKQELLHLKGIGEKMAGYILELRDTSPLESLNDLGKIGLSSKQVQNMFGRTAKGLFD